MTETSLTVNTFMQFFFSGCFRGHSAPCLFPVFACFGALCQRALFFSASCTPIAKAHGPLCPALRPGISLLRPRLALSRHFTALIRHVSARTQLYSSLLQPIPAYSRADSGILGPILAYPGIPWHTLADWPYFGSAASSASTAPMLSSAPLSTSSPTAYEKRMHLSSPKAAPGTTATWALSSSRVHSSVELLTLPP